MASLPYLPGETNSKGNLDKEKDCFLLALHSIDTFSTQRKAIPFCQYPSKSYIRSSKKFSNIEMCWFTVLL